MISAGVLKFSAFYLFVKRLIICTACLLLQKLHTTDDNNKPTNQLHYESSLASSPYYFIFYSCFSDSNDIDGISSDTVSLLPSLKTLDLSFNKFIKILGGTLQTMPRIRRLKLSNNYINEIDQGTFHHLENLGKL